MAEFVVSAYGLALSMALWLALWVIIGFSFVSLLLALATVVALPLRLLRRYFKEHS